MKDKQNCRENLRILYLTLVSAAAPIFLTAACASSVWRVDALRTSGSLYYGLWRICSSTETKLTCFAYQNASKKEWLLASRFLMTLSIPPSILTAAFIFIATYKYIRRPRPIPSSLIVIFAPILSGCLALASVVAFGSRGKELGKSFGYAFAFGILGTVLDFLNLLVYLWIRKKTTQVSIQPIHTGKQFVVKMQNISV